MERRRQARTPVNINALLVGEKTVPKGCRVMNVSQNGMQLQCDADGRLLTFKDGDSVDVHLSIQHEGKLKKLTIPSWVRHVAANSVDVEFHRQDPQLVDLIESYRISEQHRLEASLGRKNRRVAGSRPVPAAVQAGSAGLQPAPTTPKQNNRPLYTIILAMVFTVCVITGGYVYTASIDNRISTLETLSQRQSAELSEIQDRIFSASLQEGRYASLNARLTALGNAFVSLESRLTGAMPAAPGATPQQTDSAARPDARGSAPATASGPVGITLQPGQLDAATTTPATAESSLPAASHPEQAGARLPAARPDMTTTGAEDTDTAATRSAPKRAQEESAEPVTTAPTVAKVAANSNAPATTDPDPDQTGDETTGSVTTTTTAATAAGIDTPAATGPDPKSGAPASREEEALQAAVRPVARSGPWVINLISSTDKAYVERFSMQSGAERHEAVMNSAMVKGRRYWRLQITGFESASAARKHAVTVKRELGIKDVWIFRQK